VRRREETAFQAFNPRATCPLEISMDRWFHEGYINGGGLIMQVVDRQSKEGGGVGIMIHRYAILRFDVNRWIIE